MIKQSSAFPEWRSIPLPPCFGGLFRYGIVILLLLSSCQYGEKKLPPSTPAFDSVLSKADRLYDSGYKMKALNYVMVYHSQAKKLSITDEMNYYIYCSEIYRKDLQDYDTYIAYADSIISAVDKSNQGKNLLTRYVHAYNMKADALFAKGLYNESYEYYFQAKILAEKTGDSCELSKYSYSLGMALYRQQRYLESAQYFIESYNEAAQCRDVFIYFYHKQELLDNIGLCYYKAQRYDSAMSYYNKALRYIDSNYLRFDKKESVYLSPKAVVLGNMADIYLIHKNYDTAKALLNKSIAINLQKGSANTDALLSQVKLANLYFKDGETAIMLQVLQDIKAELDTLPDRQVELSWHKLMWQYYELEKDSVKAHRHALAYIALNDSFIAANKTLMTTDIDGRIKNIEQQYQINLKNKNGEYEKIYLVVSTLIAIMALVIVLLVMKNASRSRNNVIMLSLLNDQVNEQKEKLEKAIAELNQKERDKSRILRSVAHDVMNPISSIIALNDIIINESDNYSNDHKEMLYLIKEACNNSLSLSKNIVEAAMDVDEGNMGKEWVDIKKLTSNCVDLLNSRASAKKQQIKVTSHVGDNDDILAFVNKEKIWRVINNLIANAIKFSFENSVIDVSLEFISGQVSISIKDTGMGIPERNKPHIFDMFTQAKVPGTSGELPYGLGLSISLQIAKAHHGNIWFESVEGKGSTFHFEFPAKSSNY